MKSKDLVGLHQKMVTKTLQTHAPMRYDISIFFAASFSLRRSCGATTRYRVLLGLINPRVRKIRNEVVYVRFVLLIVCLYICVCECLLYNNNHKTKHKNNTNCGSNTWSLSHLGYLYPGTTPVMIKLDHNRSCPWV